jgi:hypothetical protein
LLEDAGRKIGRGAGKIKQLIYREEEDAGDKSAVICRKRGTSNSNSVVYRGTANVLKRSKRFVSSATTAAIWIF